jgi:hypothetical protein
MIKSPPHERSCEDCTLCCKVFEVPPIDNKPRGQWCKHCKPGKGCGIWEARPQFCRDFQCLFILDARLGPEWRPNTSKFVLNKANATTLHVTVDPGAPQAYRKEPYFTALKRMAQDAMGQGGSIVIFTGDRKYLLLPDGEHLLGGRGENLSWQVSASAGGYRVQVARQDDAAAAA